MKCPVCDGKRFLFIVRKVTGPTVTLTPEPCYRCNGDGEVEGKQSASS